VCVCVCGLKATGREFGLVLGFHKHYKKFSSTVYVWEFLG